MRVLPLLLLGVATSACTSEGGNVASGPASPAEDASVHAMFDGGAPTDASLDAPSKKLANCGDVVPAPNHPPFEAIKRLATTTGEVRILVYGQSISQLAWWRQVRDWLKATYPSGNLVMETHARGSCGADCLVGRTAWFQDSITENRLPGDVFAWHPDLILFHVYGADDDYEWVLKGFAGGCAAYASHATSTVRCRADQLAQAADYKKPEVLVQTDHQRGVSYPTIQPGFEFIRAHNEQFLPAAAPRYGFGLGDIYRQWASYLDTHGGNPEALLADGLHLNDAGNALMASLIERDLCYKLE